MNWKHDDAADSWWVQVMPNPIGLQLEIERAGKSFVWNVYATTSDHCEKIHSEFADRPTLGAAQAEAIAYARGLLLGLQGNVAAAFTRLT